MALLATTYFFNIYYQCFLLFPFWLQYRKYQVWWTAIFNYLISCLINFAYLRGGLFSSDGDKEKDDWGKFNSSQSKEKVNHYLCNIAMASLVFSWSSPNVKAKRRASSLIPLKDGDDRSKLYPFSWIISLKSCVNKTFSPRS